MYCKVTTTCRVVSAKHQICRNNKAETWAMMWLSRWASQSLTVSSSEPSKLLIRKLSSLWFVESNCCFEIRSISDKIWQNSSQAWHKNCIRLLFIQKNHVCCLIIHSDRKLELSQQQNVAELIYFVCHAVNATEGSTTFVFEALLNKKSSQTKLIFFFQAFKWRIMFLLSTNKSIRCGNRAWPIFSLRSFPSIIYFLHLKLQKK